jgi:hypothetical protein
MRRESVSSPLAVLLVFGLSLGSLLSAACAGDSSAGAARPHVEHVTLPTHKTWRVTSVVPYEGLEEVELVKFDWPMPDDPHAAFALSKEGLKVGDPICLDHVQEIDTFWAHPVPAGGCEALGKPVPATP